MCRDRRILARVFVEAAERVPGKPAQLVLSMNFSFSILFKVNELKFRTAEVCRFCDTNRAVLSGCLGSTSADLRTAVPETNHTAHAPSDPQRARETETRLRLERSPDCD